MFLIAAILLPHDEAAALLLTGGAVLALLLIGIHNALDTVTYIVVVKAARKE